MGKYDDAIGSIELKISVKDLLEDESDQTMSSKALYEALNTLQGELQQQLLDAAEELELDPALRRAPDPELIQVLAAVQAVKDYLAERKGRCK